MKFLIVVDMQNDFIDGALGTAEAVQILPAVAEKIRGFDGTVIYTRDTHTPDYMQTQEGANLPVIHCVQGEDGWQLPPVLDELRTQMNSPVFQRNSLFSTKILANSSSGFSVNERTEYMFSSIFSFIWI